MWEEGARVQRRTFAALFSHSRDDSMTSFLPLTLTVAHASLSLLPSTAARAQVLLASAAACMHASLSLLMSSFRGEKSHQVTLCVCC